MSPSCWEWTSPYLQSPERRALDDLKGHDAWWKSHVQQRCLADLATDLRAHQQLDAAAANLNRLSKEGF